MCLLLGAFMLASGCSAAPAEPVNTEPDSPEPTAVDLPDGSAPALADVIAASAGGEANGYQFTVTVASPDTGCDQYADWWEILTEDGELLYRRVLLHSHPGEQPFNRSGGPVPVEADAVIIVRAHMQPGGHGGAALRGTVAGGFAPVELEPGFAAVLASLPPLPESCAF